MKKIMYVIVMTAFMGLEGKIMKELSLTSPAFNHAEKIPFTFTCDGHNISPELKWDNVPQGTKSFALIVDDPDAPKGTWVHWVVFNVPALARSLAENVRIDKQNLGSTSFEENPMGYGGPCPPRGETHNYRFKLYALDTMLSVKPGITADDLMIAMENHILSQAVLVGKYKRIK